MTQSLAKQLERALKKGPLPHDFDRIVRQLNGRCNRESLEAAIEKLTPEGKVRRSYDKQRERYMLTLVVK